MDLASIFLTLAVALLVGLFISRPFANRRTANEVLVRPASEESEVRRSSLLAERDRVINALQDLEFDYTLGKIPEQDYPTQRGELLKNGAEMLRQLDELAGVKADTSAEDRVEAVVAARRADAAQRRAVSQAAGAVAAVAVAAPQVSASRRPPAPVEDDLEIEIAARRRARQEKAGGFCPKCGRPAALSDRFCSKCGATL